MFPILPARSCRSILPAALSGRRQAPGRSGWRRRWCSPTTQPHLLSRRARHLIGEQETCSRERRRQQSPSVRGEGTHQPGSVDCSAKPARASPGTDRTKRHGRTRLGGRRSRFPVPAPTSRHTPPRKTGPPLASASPSASWRSGRSRSAQVEASESKNPSICDKPFRCPSIWIHRDLTGQLTHLHSEITEIWPAWPVRYDPRKFRQHRNTLRRRFHFGHANPCNSVSWIHSLPEGPECPNGSVHASVRRLGEPEVGCKPGSSVPPALVPTGMLSVLIPYVHGWRELAMRNG